MNERSSLIVILIALLLGSQLRASMGDNFFYLMLAAGWAVAIIWTVVAWRRGESVFVWQKRNG